jgi:hypothetical protein
MLLCGPRRAPLFMMLLPGAVPSAALAPPQVSAAPLICLASIKVCREMKSRGAGRLPRSVLDNVCHNFASRHGRWRQPPAEVTHQVGHTVRPRAAAMPPLAPGGGMSSNIVLTPEPLSRALGGCLYVLRQGWLGHAGVGSGVRVS